MKKLYTAIIGGMLFPALYLLVVAVVSNVFNIFLPFLLRLPLLWAGTLYNHFFPDTDDFQMFAEFRYEVILSNLVGNFLFYAGITYVILWWRENRPTNKYL
jgi:hypothetical protein